MGRGGARKLPDNNCQLRESFRQSPSQRGSFYVVKTTAGNFNLRNISSRDCRAVLPMCRKDDLALAHSLRCLSTIIPGGWLLAGHHTLRYALGRAKTITHRCFYFHMVRILAATSMRICFASRYARNGADDGPGSGLEELKQRRGDKARPARIDMTVPPARVARW